jgi:hypothetical protein
MNKVKSIRFIRFMADYFLDKVPEKT